MEKLFELFNPRILLSDADQSDLFEYVPRNGDEQTNKALWIQVPPKKIL